MRRTIHFRSPLTAAEWVCYRSLVAAQDEAENELRDIGLGGPLENLRSKALALPDLVQWEKELTNGI